MTEEISKNLMGLNRFILSDRYFFNGKKPFSRGKKDDFNAQLVNYETANAWIKKGQNVGFCFGEGFLGIDADALELVPIVKELLPATYEEETTSGGLHFIFRFFGKAENRNLNLNGKHLGEIRANRQYVIIAPSIAKSKIDGQFKQYKIINDVAPAVLTQKQLQTFLDKFPEIKSDKPQGCDLKERGIDRSAYDFAKCCELIEKGSADYSDICMKMRKLGSSKWQKRAETYRRMTFKAALRKVKS